MWALLICLCLFVSLIVCGLLGLVLFVIRCLLNLFDLLLLLCSNSIVSYR